MREWLKSLRTNKNFTMSEVSKQAGISESYYSMIDSGNRISYQEMSRGVGYKN